MDVIGKASLYPGGVGLFICSGFFLNGGINNKPLPLPLENGRPSGLISPLMQPDDPGMLLAITIEYFDCYPLIQQGCHLF
jgi:hypothetical protein